MCHQPYSPSLGCTKVSLSTLHSDCGGVSVSGVANNRALSRANVCDKWGSPEEVSMSVGYEYYEYAVTQRKHHCYFVTLEKKSGWSNTCT